jgi:dTDP-L-rhamnose 4-epimerase
MPIHRLAPGVRDRHVVVKVLVTGGAGFVGSHVVDALCDRGADVRVLDWRHSPSLDRRAEVVLGDVRDPAVVTRAVRGVDAVCHQAAKVGLGVDFGDVGEYVSNNDQGTAVLLDALWGCGFAGRLVLASSMVIYGEARSRCPEHGLVTPGPRRADDLAIGRFEPVCPVPGCYVAVTWEPVDEDATPDPRNTYAATKLHQEHLCQVWGREASATVVRLRYHNVYGPRMPDDTPYAGVVSLFAGALRARRAPQVFEDGRQMRDFVHVRDVARANVLALLDDDVEAGAYNIASGTPRTVGEVALALSTAFGRDAPPPVVTGGWRLGDVRHIVASPKRASTGLGFRAEISLEEGMAEFAALEAPPAPVA